MTLRRDHTLTPPTREGVLVRGRRGRPNGGSKIAASHKPRAPRAAAMTKAGRPESPRSGRPPGPRSSRQLLANEHGAQDHGDADHPAGGEMGASAPPSLRGGLSRGGRVRWRRRRGKHRAGEADFSRQPSAPRATRTEATLGCPPLGNSGRGPATSCLSQPRVPARPASAHGRHVAMQIATTIRRRSIGWGASVPYTSHPF
jgi:hypothetical protein